MADSPEGHSALQRDLDKLERWVGKTLMKLKKKCRVLPLERNNPRHQDMVGAKLESSSAEKALGILVDIVEHESAICPFR